MSTTPSIRAGRCVRLALVATVAGLLAGPSLAQTPAPATPIQAALSGAAKSGQSVAGERLLEREVVSRFFEARGFAPAWSAEAAQDVLRAIRAIEHDGLLPEHYHLEALEQNPAIDTPEVQLLVTDAVAALLDDVRYGKVAPSSLDKRWNVNPRAGAPPLESLVAQVASAQSPAAAIEALKPTHFIYKGLKEALARLREMAAEGGWPPIPEGPALKPGAADPRVPLLRQRLAATGGLAMGTGGDVYDAELEAALKRFQEGHRLATDGVLGKDTLAALNEPAESRARQVRVNLERARWVLGGLTDSFILVNLPAFKVYYIRDGQNIWETRSQIGREARQTPSFRAEMRYIVLNPDWTVPPTILEEDVLGGMRKGQNTLAQKGLTILDERGNRVDPSTIDWSSASAGDFPYTLRQPPGPDNALGRVKFMFPNDHAIFLHDTPSKELFSDDLRTFSSGCIRIENPLELAELLLQGHDGWDRVRIDSTVASGKLTQVDLPEPLPVLIVYWTVSVGASGELRFARDVYDRDPPVLKALDAAPRPR